MFPPKWLIVLVVTIQLLLCSVLLTYLEGNQKNTMSDMIVNNRVFHTEKQVYLLQSKSHLLAAKVVEVKGNLTSNIAPNNEVVEEDDIEEFVRKQKEEQQTSQQGLVELGTKQKQDFSYTPSSSDELLEVFVIPHSHCDPGWLKTFEQYYNEQVSAIISTITSTLTSDPTKRFGWVEVSFLERWWRDQSEEIRKQFKALVKNNQIELLMAGWVSSDEASTNYIQVVNQMTEGHKWVLRNIFDDDTYSFNKYANNQKNNDQQWYPSVGWQIDPFGLSQIYPSLFSQMGFSANVAWRISEPEMREYLKQDVRQLEFVWRGSDSIGEASDLLMHLLPWGYEAPRDYLFQQARPITAEHEAKEAARQLVTNFKGRAESYRYNILMWPWGHDFRFTDAAVMFNSMDKILNEINNNEEFKVKVRYATPREYFSRLQELKQQDGNEISFPTKNKDFFPYHAGPVNWWTGYYTSRPLFKRQLRVTDHLQRTADMLFALARTIAPSPSDTAQFKKLEALRHAQGIMQHHDAITGTMREHVLADYKQMIDKTLAPVIDIAQQSLRRLLQTTSSNENVDFKLRAPPSLDSLSNINNMKQTRAYPKQVTVFNSLGWKNEQYIRVRVTNPQLKVMDYSGKVVKSQIVPFWKRLTHNLELDGYELYFAANVDALAAKTFFIVESALRVFDSLQITVINNSGQQKQQIAEQLKQLTGIKITTTDQLNTISMKNDKIAVTFSSSSGAMTQVTNLKTSNNYKLSQSYHYYHTDPKWANQYTFKSNGDSVAFDSTLQKGVLLQGPLVQQFTRTVGHKIEQVVRLYQSSSFIEVEETVGAPDTSTEIVTRYDSDIKSASTFYTDDNGLEMIKREFNKNILISGNVYPSVYSSCVRSPQLSSNKYFSQLYAIFDRPHGITSNTAGQIEVMLHRNAQQSLGNGEPLSDTHTVTIVSRLLFDMDDVRNRVQHAMKLNFPPAMFESFANVPNVQQWQQKLNLLPSTTFLKKELPDNTFLMTLQQHSATTTSTPLITMRINHIVQKNEPVTDLNKDVALDLSNIFNRVKITSLQERTLSLMVTAEANKRFHWHHDGEQAHVKRKGAVVAQANNGKYSVSSTKKLLLEPMQIRSFLLNLSRS